MNYSNYKIYKYLINYKTKIDYIVAIIIIDLFVYTNFSYYNLIQILCGANIIINDNSFFYKKWIYHYKHNKGSKLYKSYSSHYSKKNQYRLNGNIIYNINGDKNMTFDILIGITQSNNTWFQFERNNVSTIFSFIKHLLNYIEYTITGYNIGPFGKSIYNYNNPIVLIIQKTLS